ncbi:hypothetical protein Zmor_007107 [Zophobas morio]|uniref:Uncharacterized protein n=1 Tax=Zophobas morio TaxID=2755281 RepID=A0AA38IW42_9CUCU|nr:hypothetical protein Zmor_007107 [Zophobas morio]
MVDKYLTDEALVKILENDDSSSEYDFSNDESHIPDELEAEDDDIDLSGASAEKNYTIKPGFECSSKPPAQRKRLVHNTVNAKPGLQNNEERNGGRKLRCDEIWSKDDLFKQPYFTAVLSRRTSTSSSDFTIH